MAALTEQLAACEDGVDSLNGFLVGDLLDLGGREALSAMEAAFEAGVVDEAVAGGWQEVRRRFNLAPSREELPGRPPPDLFARRPQDGHTTSRAAKSKRKKKLAKASRRKNRRK